MSRLKEVNSVWFDLTKPNGKKLMIDHINSLLEYNNRSDQGYVMDIHIKYEDGDCYVVESVQKDIENREIGGEFVFKNFEEIICKEIRLPNNTYVTIDADEDEDTYIQNWVDNEHPGEYARNDLGNWYNVAEQKAWEKEIAKKSK